MKKLLLLLLCTGPLIVFAQQDPLYSQYQFNQHVVNPAYTGINNNTSFGFVSRIQWSGLGGGPSGSPVTNTLSAQTAIAGNKVGLGALLVQDKLGVANNFEGHLTYSYKIAWDDKALSFGLQTSIISVNYDYSALNLKYLDDPEFQGGNLRASKPNFGTGVALMSDQYFFGISVPRLLNTQFDDNVMSEFRYDRHFYAYAAYLLDLSAAVKFKPSLMTRYVEGANLSYDLNTSFLLYNQYWVGAFTRSFASAGVMFQVDLKNAYRIGYMAEIPFNGLPANYLTHEFMLSIDLALFGEQEVFQRFF